MRLPRLHTQLILTSHDYGHQESGQTWIGGLLVDDRASVDQPMINLLRPTQALLLGQ